MKKLLFFLLIAGPLWAATTYTTRTGIPKPADSDTDWGTTLRAGYDVIDSSMVVINSSQTITGSNIFTSSQTFSSKITAPLVYIATAAYPGTEVLAVNGSAKFFGPLGGSLSICDQNGINCVNITNAAGPTFSSMTVTTMTISVLTVTTVTPTSIIGVTNGSNASVGSYGQYVSSYTLLRAGSTTNWVDIAQIFLSSGDWNVDGFFSFKNSATATQVHIAVSSCSANNTNDHAIGDNWGINAWSIDGSSVTAAVSGYRKSLSAGTTMYVKGHMVGGGTPFFSGRISARRAR